MKEDLLKWILGSDRDFNQGIMLLSMHTHNQAMVKNISKNPKRYAEKLLYEICKAAGYSIEEATRIIAGAKLPAPVVPEKIEMPKPKAIEIKKEIKAIPKEIERLFKETSSTVNERALLHKQLSDLPETNDLETVATRKNLIQLIEKCTDTIDLLSKAREDWYSDGKLPDFSLIYKKEEKELTMNERLDGLDGYDLMKRKKNLESSITKDKNLLVYQNKTKQKKENQMPVCPERYTIEKRIVDKQAELDEINKRVNK